MIFICLSGEIPAGQCECFQGAADSRRKLRGRDLLQKAADPVQRIGIDQLLQAACCEALYVLGRKEALEELLGLFSQGDAQAQCFILNGLQELVNPYALDRIRRFLEEIPTADLPPAVRSSKEELTLTCRNFTR